MFYMMTDHLSEAYKSIYQRKDLTSPPKDAEGMTGKMNPQGEPKAAHGGDHANAPESMVRGRYRAAYEDYKDDLRDHHLEKFTKWMETISEGGYDITRWEKEELIETYIKENNLWESRDIVFEAVESFDLQENRRAARAAGASKDDTKKQPDPSKDGFTGIGNMSIDAIRKMSARIEKEKTKKEEVEVVDEGSMKQARKNVGASTCWDGYKAKGTKTKNGRQVPNCVKEEELSDWRKDILSEEGYDRMRDRKLEMYGSGYRSAGSRRSVARSGGTQPKPMPQKKKDGPSALDIVKGEIEKKYGKGAIMDVKKKKKD